MSNQPERDPESTRSPDARCPRCGYDQRGVIESWDEVCPIQGTCTECGLEFEWGELLSPVRNMPRWCVEYATGWRVIPASIKTLALAMLLPRRFWSELRMTHTPRWWRIAGILLVAVMILYVVFAASIGLEAYRLARNTQTSGAPILQPPWQFALLAIVNPFAEQTVSTQPRQTAGRFRRRYGPVASPRDMALNKLYPLRKLWRSTRVAVRTGSFLWPWGHRDSDVALVHGLLILLLCPLSFLALPRSLRKAKVRVVHIVRIWLYSVAMLLIPFVLMLMPAFGPGPLRQLWWDAHEYLVIGAAAGGLVVWWSLASGHYLKLPHAWSVGASMVLLAYVSGLFMIVLADYGLFLLRG